MNEEIESPSEADIPTPPPSEPPPAPPEASPAPAKPARSRFERREQASADALRGLLRDFFAEVAPEQALTEPLTLNIQVELIPGEPGELFFKPSLRKQLSRQMPVAPGGAAGFVEGFVYNHHDESPEGPGCRPAEADQVFAGYDAMGRPQWVSYTQYLLDQRDEAVDQLHQRHGAPVTRVQRGKDLKAEQTGSFGKSSRVYSLLGQLTSGYFELPKAFHAVAGADRFALTVQVAETRDPKGRLMLGLNVIAGGLLPVDLPAVLQEHRFRGLSGALERARLDLAELEQEARVALAARESDKFQQVMRRVPRIIQSLRDHLEGRQAPKRPGPKQDDRWKTDLPDAGLQELVFDSARDSWILLGASGQAHVFAPNGRHITSFPVTPDLIEKRIVSGRWLLEAAGGEAVLEKIRQG